MKKVLFTTLSIIAVAAMMFVSCKKDEPKPDDNKGKTDPVEEYAGPVVGTENWAIIGTILSTNWDTDYKAALVSENIFVVKNVKLEAANEFKWRDTSSENDGWAINRGGDFVALGEAFDVEANGHNIKPELDGIYDIYLNLAVDQAAVVEKDGTPTWGERKFSWDYTPSEAYAAETNLWKPADAEGGTFYFVYSCNGADWNGVDTETDNLENLTKEQSTYKLHLTNPTYSQWQNQFMIHPKADKAVELSVAYNYVLSVTVGANKKTPGFFKFSKFNAAGAPKYEGECLYEKGVIELGPDPITIVSDTLKGKSCDNLTLTFDFGGNPEDIDIYIKDITLVATKKVADEVKDMVAKIPTTATGSSSAADYEVNLAGATVSYVNGNNAYIQDNSGAILIYLANHGFAIGDVISGKLAGKGYWFNGIPEVTSIGTEFVKTAGAAPAPKEMTIKELLDNYDANLLRLVKLSGVTVTDAIADGDRNGEVTQGEDKVAVYAQLNNKGLVLTKDAYGDLVTIPAYYKTNKQVYLWDNAWFTPSIKIDGSFADWGAFEGVTAGSNTFKAASDANNIYLYSKRANTGRYSDIWGGTGYVYFGFDLDNNPDTGDGVHDWLSGQHWEAVILTYPYAGTADAKAMATEISNSWWIVPSTFTIANLTFKGAVEEDGAAFEVCIPRKDMPAIPTTKVTLKSWGNKDLGTAVLECTL